MQIMMQMKMQIMMQMTMQMTIQMTMQMNSYILNMVTMTIRIEFAEFLFKHNLFLVYRICYNHQTHPAR